MNNLTSASKKNLCPVCGKDNWCYQLNPSLWCCKRSDESPPGWHRTTKQDRDGAQYFVIDEDHRGDREAQQEEWAREKALPSSRSMPIDWQRVGR